MSPRKIIQKARSTAGRPTVDPEIAEAVETSFAEVVGLIEQAQQRAFQAINSELVGLYWRIGQYISAKTLADTFFIC